MTTTDEEEFPLLFKAKQLLEFFGTRMDEQGDLHDFLLRYNSSWLLGFKELVSISKSVPRMKNDFEVILKSWPAEFNIMLKRFAIKEDHEWVSDLKGFTTFDFRCHFSNLMFPTGLEDESIAKLQISVDRSNILEDSFRELINIDPS